MLKGQNGKTRQNNQRLTTIKNLFNGMGSPDSLQMDLRLASSPGMWLDRGQREGKLLKEVEPGARPLPLVDNSPRAAGPRGTPAHQIISDFFVEINQWKLISRDRMLIFNLGGGLSNHLHIRHASCLISAIIHLLSKVFLI